MEPFSLKNIGKKGSFGLKSFVRPLETSLNLRTPNGQPFRVTHMVQFKSLQLLPQEQQDEIFLASMKKGDFIELPTYIFVETRFITKHSGEFAEFAAEFEAMELAGSNQEAPSLTVASPQTDTQKYDTSDSLPLKLFVDVGVSAGVVQKECGTETESPCPLRSRCQQTDFPRFENVGIQCCIEMELDFGDDANVDVTQTANDSDENNYRVIFEAFVKKNALPHSNGKVECRLCGEVQLNMKYMESHLKLHYGPKALCFRCGVQFENKIELRDHVCDAKKFKAAMRLHCPHYRCNLVAISQLELFDHINEHCSDDCYKCKNCGSAYPTAKELQQHAKLRKKCRGLKLRFPYNRQHLQGTHNLLHRIRVQVIHKINGTKALRVSRLDKCSIKRCVKQCPVCLKVCSNEFKYRNHRKRCLAYYVGRFKRKLNKEQNIYFQYYKSHK